MNHHELSPKERITQADGFVALKQVEVLGNVYLIDELFEEEELDRLYIELGLESDEEEDLEEQLSKILHINNEDLDDDNQEGG